MNSNRNDKPGQPANRQSTDRSQNPAQYNINRNSSQPVQQKAANTAPNNVKNHNQARHFDRPPVISGKQIAFEVFLLLLSLLILGMFISFIQVEYRTPFVKTIAPTMQSKDSPLDAVSKLSESDIPTKAENDPLETDGPGTDPGTEYQETDIYDFSKPVPASELYPTEYFEDTIFIGDSRTAGVVLYTDLKPINYTATGLNINQLSDKAFLKYEDPELNEVRNITVYEGLELNKGKYKAVYMSLGINELGWNTKQHVSLYRETISEILEIIDVPLYIQLILPVTKEYSESSQFGITNEKALKFNENIRNLADELDIFLLDPTELFALEDGTLNPEESFDGVHLEVPACRKMAEFYRTHVVNPDDYSNLVFEEETESEENAD